MTGFLVGQLGLQELNAFVVRLSHCGNTAAKG